MTIGSLETELVGAVLYDVLRTALGELRRRRGWKRSVVRYCQSRGIELTDAEARRLVDWLRNAELDTIAGGRSNLVGSLDAIVFRTWDHAAQRGDLTLPEAAERNRTRADLLASEMWSALSQVLDAHELATVRAAVGAIHSADVADSVLEELGLLRDNLGELARGLAGGLPLERPFLRFAPGVRVSPYQLLWPRTAAVPYIDAHAWMPSLLTWCDDNSRISVRILHGIGGAGKTRLALETCRTMARRGWVAGIYRDLGPDALLRLGRVQEPRLVVIDYADNQPGLVREVLAALVAEMPRWAYRARLILVTRRGGRTRDPRRWFTGHGDLVTQLVDEATVVDLSEADEDGGPTLPMAARDELFSGAVNAYARRLGTQAPAQAPDLRDDRFGTPLFVLVAAVLAVLEPSATAGVVDADKLLDRVLEREQVTHWTDAPDPDRRLQRRQVALSTLIGADDESEAVAHLEAVRDWGGSSSTVRSALWLHELYEGHRWLNPLEPDLLGEHLVAEDLNPSVLRYLASLGPTPSAIRGFTVLARVVLTRPELHERVAAALAGSLPELTAAIDEVLRRGGDTDIAVPVADLVDQLVLEPSAVDRALRIVTPRAGHGNVFAAVLAGKAVDVAARRAVDEPGPTTADDLALALVRHSNWLAGLGEYRRSSELLAEALHLWAGVPDADARRIASASNSLGNRGRLVGFHEQALDAATSAVEINRRLSDGVPLADRVDLAMSLTTLSAVHADRRRFEQARSAAEEVVGIRRARHHLGLSGSALELALSLNNLSIRQRECGDNAAALASIDEAIALLRPLVDGSWVARHRLAAATQNRGLVLSWMGPAQYADAVTSTDEAVDMWRDLADDSPELYRRSLADSLNNLAVMLGRVLREHLSGDPAPTAGNPDAYFLADGPPTDPESLNLLARSRKAIDEAIGVLRDLVESDRLAFSPMLARSLNTSALLALDEHRFEAAASPIEESVEIRRWLAEAEPDVYTDDLTIALLNQSLVLSRQDPRDDDRCLRAVEECIELRRILMAEQPSYAPKLASALKSRAKVLDRLGRDEDAQMALREAAALQRTE